jgi:glycyl-tRNA synthetase alpha subunit
MLKTMVEKIEKILKGKLDNSSFKEKITKHPNYLLKAKEIWNMINEDLGISNTVENKFISKVGKFEKAVLAKFPELTKGDIIELKKSIIGGVNVRKDVVLNQVDHLKQLQIFNTKLKEENEKLKEQLSKFNINETLEIDKALEKESKTVTDENMNKDNK